MTRRWLLWIAAIVAIPLLLVPPLHYGWTHIETDFPNYYTAAWMARHHVPLRDLYDWTSFQRQMNYAGWGLQLGGYIPHTPLTALPMFPLAALDPMTAKRAWLLFSVACLAAPIWILSRLTRVSAAGLVLLAVIGHNALAGNLELGQYYFFLLFLMTVSFWLYFSGRDFSAGLLLGAIFILKLYAAPFLLYFAWKRRWRAFAGMAVAGLILAIISVTWFGWTDHVYYLRDILPRAIAGEHIDPYATGMPTILNMIRHAFQAEPSLNPHPLADAPALMFFLQSLATLAIPTLCLIAIPRTTSGESERAEIAWFLIMLVLVSPSRAFYAAVLLLLPVALLLEKATLRRAVWLIAAYLLVSNSLPDAWEPFFPSIMVLLAAYVALGIPYWRKLRPAFAAAAAVAIIGVAAISSTRRMASFHREPPQRYERVAFEKDAIYSGTPSVSPDGIVYESIDDNRYLLKRWNQGRMESFPFDGQAFHPSVAAVGGPIYFELVADRHSRIMAYDRATKDISQVVAQSFEPTHPAVSPDGQFLAFIAEGRIIVSRTAILGTVNGPTPVHDVAWFPDSLQMVYSAGPSGASQIYATRSGGTSEQLTNDAGDHSEPAVSLDGKWLAFTLARGGTRQVWVQNLTTGKSSQLTEGNCNSFSPAWEPDSRAVIFDCDCQRGIGLPALFRAPLLR